MWIAQYNAHLGVRCSKCGEHLDGELSDSTGYPEQTIIVTVECSCTNELEQKVAQLEEELKEKRGGE